MKNFAFACIFILLFSSCKKDESAADNSSLFLDFNVSANTGATSIPAIVHFTTAIPDSADAVTWDFGDSTTATSFSINHIYQRYGNFNVTLTATKGSRTGSITKVIPVTIYKKFQINQVQILKSDLYNSFGNYWDSGTDKADITTVITMPNGIVYHSPVILNNSDTGTIRIIPPLGTTALEGSVKVELYDVDTIAGSSNQIISSFNFNITSFIKPTLPYQGSADFEKGNNKIRVLMTWVP